jgi:hypothetical protein
LVLFEVKLHVEEELMLATFPDEYPGYRQRVPQRFRDFASAGSGPSVRRPQEADGLPREDLFQIKNVAGSAERIASASERLDGWTAWRSEPRNSPHRVQRGRGRRRGRLTPQAGPCSPRVEGRPQRTSRCPSHQQSGSRTQAHDPQPPARLNHSTLVWGSGRLHQPGPDDNRHRV